MNKLDTNFLLKQSIKSRFKNYELSTSIPEALVNVEEKTRSNLFTWRGQFHPQLVEQILLHYASQDDHVFDPFLGSGTVLFECGVLNLKATGTEINPAAVSFAKIYELINSSKREINKAINTIEKLVSKYTNILPSTNSIPIDTFESNLLNLLKENPNKTIRTILLALITGMDFEAKKLDIKRINNVWGTLRSNVENLPNKNKKLRCHQRDARQTKLPKNSVDLVITSPPYINVFNYHQNYRKSIEKIGVDVLSVARSEIGSNRKFRPNRFLTVVQYCMDMAMVFCELKRVCNAKAKVIFIVGRESNVRKTSFKNAELILEVAEACGFELAGKQHRKFMNKFGETIIEEILRFQNIDVPVTNIHEQSRKIGQNALKKAKLHCSESVLKEITEAIKKSDNILHSPILI